MLDQLREALPATPGELRDPSIWSLRPKLESLRRQDPLGWGDALAQVIVDSRTWTTFTAVIAAQYYREFAESPGRLLWFFRQAGEPGERLVWVFLALSPPLTRSEQLEVFGYACEAAWALYQLKHDSLLVARQENGHHPLPRFALDGIIEDAERVTEGDLHTMIGRMRHLATPD